MSAQDKEWLKVIDERKEWNPHEESRVKALLAAGANPNVQDQYGTAPLHVAADEGNLALVKLLIENGANLNVEDVNHQTPLLFAATL